MKIYIKERIVFLGRSLVWSVLLFSVLMLVINFDDLKQQFTGNYVTVTCNQDTTLQKVNRVTVSTKAQIVKPKV